VFLKCSGFSPAVKCCHVHSSNATRCLLLCVLWLQANIHSIMGSEDQVLELMLLLDTGLQQANKIEEKLTEYERKLQVITRAHSFPRAAEFGRCREISVFPRNFTEFCVNTEIPRQRPTSVNLYCCSNCCTQSLETATQAC